MEYFIIDRGYMWDSILEILRQKAAEGVEVRIMYDGMCCLILPSLPLSPETGKNGNPLSDVFTLLNRCFLLTRITGDHRKITVIDGHTALLAESIWQMSILIERTFRPLGKIRRSWSREMQ